MSYSLNSLDGTYTGGYIGFLVWGLMKEPRSLDYGICEVRCFEVCYASALS